MGELRRVKGSEEEVLLLMLLDLKRAMPQLLDEEPKIDILIGNTNAAQANIAYDQLQASLNMIIERDVRTKEKIRTIKPSADLEEQGSEVLNLLKTDSAASKQDDTERLYYITFHLDDMCNENENGERALKPDVAERRDRLINALSRRLMKKYFPEKRGQEITEEDKIALEIKLREMAIGNLEAKLQAKREEQALAVAA